MKVGFVVNDVITEKPEYSTTRLALAAQKREHEVWLMGVGDLAHASTGEVTARARGPLDKTYRSLKSFLEDVQSEDVDAELITVDELDVLMLRNDPAEDATDRPWAQASGVLFGQLAAAAGVVVVNDPVHLADAINKTYFQHFPEEIRPRTLISRTVGDIKAFIEDLGGRAVLKPLQGSGGQSVFVIAGKKGQNVNQIIETITRDGYVVVQEFLEDAEKGDVRLFVMNGKPLEVDGKVAAFRRVNEGDDVRSNMHVGGKAQKVKITDEMLHVVDLARPKLIEDGMFLVGLDIVGLQDDGGQCLQPWGVGKRQRAARGRFRRRCSRCPGEKGPNPGNLRAVPAQRFPCHDVDGGSDPDRRGLENQSGGVEWIELAAVVASTLEHRVVERVGHGGECVEEPHDQGPWMEPDPLPDVLCRA